MTLFQHKALSSKKKLIFPDQAYFDHAVFDSLRESWNLYKLESKENQSLLYNNQLNTSNHQQLSEFILTNPSFIKSIENSDPQTIQNIFNQYLQLIAPVVYESSEPVIKDFFDEKFPNRSKGPGRDNKPGPFYQSIKEAKTSMSFSV